MNNTDPTVTNNEVPYLIRHQKRFLGLAGMYFIDKADADTDFSYPRIILSDSDLAKNATEEAQKYYDNNTRVDVFDKTIFDFADNTKIKKINELIDMHA